VASSVADDPWKSVTAVVVVHNSAAVVGECLKSLSRAARVIVVDNASTDGTGAVARAALPAAEIIENPLNMGYGTANNIGFERSRTPYTLLLNPDFPMALTFRRRGLSFVICFCLHLKSFSDPLVVLSYNTQYAEFRRDFGCFFSRR